MSEAKPEALELADALDVRQWPVSATLSEAAAAKLRSQHEAIVALSEALEGAEKALRVVTSTLMLPKKHAAALNLARATLTKHGVKVAEKLKQVYTAETGDNPWE